MKKNKYYVLNDVEIDFSEYEEYQLSDLEMKCMEKNIENKVKNKKFSWKKGVAVAACIAASLAVISQTAFAKNFMHGVIASFSTGHNAVSRIDPDYVPEPIDKEVLSEETENGVTTIVYVDGTSVMTSEAGSVDMSDRHLYVSENEIANYASFKPQLPTYLPEGYAFDNAYFIKSDDGSVSGDYLFVEYKNAADGKTFTIHERIMNDETGYEDGTVGEIVQVDINGNNAVMYDNSIMWETDGISVDIMGRKAGFDNDTLVKIAESVK